MTDLSNKYKQSLKQQSINLKFIELLNSNRQLQSIKDRQILPSIPLSAFNQTSVATNGLPSIHKQKNTGKLRSMSQAKLKSVQPMYDIQMQIKGINDKSGITGTKILTKQQSMSVLQSTKNITNPGFARLRKKSVSSAKRSAHSRSQKQELLTKRYLDKANSNQRQRINSNPNIQTLQINPIVMKQPSQKVLIQITPQKLKLDLPISTKHTSQAKIMSNKTLQQIGNQAMQNIMLNLKFGKIQQNISYKSFLKKQVEPSPQQIIRKLGQWIQKYKIKNGLIYTKNLHNIFSRKQIPNNMILTQFTNYQQLKKQFMKTMPGLRYYEQNQNKGKNLAATKIQSLFHLNFQRNYAKKLKSLMSKVKIIQKKWKSALALKKLRERIQQNIYMKIQKSKMLTNNLLKNWQLIKTSPRVQVHICSIALQQFKRLSIPDLQQKQISQLTRIFKSAQTDCTIVYVTPFSISPQILRYYQRVFAFGNMGESFRNRLYIISVQKILQKISSHMTTVSALLYSSEGVKKIKEIIKQKSQPIMNNPCAYIIPSYPSNQYINLSAQLDIPIFSSSQSLHKLYSTKSGYYQLLKQLSQNLGDKCPFLLPKTIHSIYSQKQLINILSVLIYKNKYITKWMLKIDDQINSRGIAIFNVDSLIFLKQLRKQYNQQQQQQQSIVQQIPQKQMINLIADQLRLKLKIRLKILHKNIYNDYQNYISHFLTRGGVIQACIQPQQHSNINNDKNIKYKIKQHSISFKISPNGQFQIQTTYSRFLLGYKTINSSIQSPSNVSVSEVDNQKIIRALYRYLWGKHKLFGYFTIDCLFVPTLNKISKQENNIKNVDNFQNGKLYIIGMDCFLNQKTSSIYIPTLITKCQFKKQQNKYILLNTNQQHQKSYAKLTNQSIIQKQYTSRTITQQSYLQQQSRVITTTIKKQIFKNQLYYIYCPFIKQNNLPDIATFFKQCKFNNISFDIETKTGTLFLLEGGLENGCLGFMCMGFTQYQVQQQALKLVQFLSKQFRDKNQKTHKNTKTKTGSDDIGQLRGYLLNSIRKHKQQHGNYKKQVINLQFIF